MALKVILCIYLIRRRVVGGRELTISHLIYVKEIETGVQDTFSDRCAQASTRHMSLSRDREVATGPVWRFKWFTYTRTRIQEEKYVECRHCGRAHSSSSHGCHSFNTRTSSADKCMRSRKCGSPLATDSTPAHSSSCTKWKRKSDPWVPFRSFFVPRRVATGTAT
jgi:hypothetical protein